LPPSKLVLSESVTVAVGSMNAAGSFSV